MWFGRSHFGSRRHCLRVFRLFALFILFASQVSRELMPRRGWQAMDVPTGWVQVLRGPRLPSQKWPSAKSGSLQMQQRHVGVSSPSSRVVKTPPSRVNPEIARETALSKVQKLEQALLLMSDCPGVVADVLKQEKARTASKRPPIGVEVEQCRKFITRSEKRVGCGAWSRIQCSYRSEGSSSALGECAEIVALKAKLAEVEGERETLRSGISRTSGQGPCLLWQVQAQISRCP